MAVYSIYKTSPSYRLDQSGTEKAIEGFQTFANNNPESSRVAECNKLIDELRGKLEKKLFEQGKLYLDLRNYQSAVNSFESLISEFPETKNHQEVRYLIIKSHYDLANASIFEKQEERYKETEAKADAFIQKYKSGKKVQEVRTIKQNAIQKLKNPEYDRYKNTSSRN
jgi:outer membrane protein assembly factor BamD